ncbi:hypothetical protein [Hahella ganghwensis]|uniref:hypothetical protein n=1 Tax=Hahella ganghwensis TaxID=286420 RepID=UPI00035C8F4C|nr:hypothetical protein [Hahella ganghwensis]
MWISGFRKARIIKESKVIKANRESFFYEKAWFLLIEDKGTEKIVIVRWMLVPLLVGVFVIDRSNFGETPSFFKEVRELVEAGSAT